MALLYGLMPFLAFMKVLESGNLEKTYGKVPQMGNESGNETEMMTGRNHGDLKVASDAAYQHGEPKGAPDATHHHLNRRSFAENNGLVGHQRDGRLMTELGRTIGDGPVDFNSLCIGGVPYVHNGSPLYCTLHSACPEGYWCHIGSSKAFTFCCPEVPITDSCSLYPSHGTGNGRMERWYFDPKSSTCKEFIYTGLRGNKNNFLTYQECVGACATTTANQGLGTEYRRILETEPYEQEITLSHSVQNLHSNDFSDPIQVVQDSEVAPREDVSGSVQLVDDGKLPPRQDFPGSIIHQRILLPLVAPVLSATSADHFIVPLTRSDDHPAVPLTPSSSSQQTLKTNSEGISSPSSSSSSRPALSVDFYPPASLASSAEGRLRTGPSERHLRCLDSVNRRSGLRKSMELGPRWYYDHVQDQCKQLPFPGVGTTLRTYFKTEFECNYYCRGKFQPSQPIPLPIKSGIIRPAVTIPISKGHQDKLIDPCSMPPNPGHGYTWLVRWHFHPDEGRCREFFYSGQGGNANNFENEDQCVFACITLMPKPLSGDPCSIPREIGHGSASLTRFYYNQWTRQCESFIYTGSGGNRNNFFTLQECLINCPDAIHPSSSPSLRLTSDHSPEPGRTLPYTIQTQHVSGGPPSLDVVYGRQPGRNVLTRPSTVVWKNPVPGKPIPLAPINPCGAGSPYEVNGRPVQCSTLQQHVCPESHYCHVGTDAATSVCCIRKGNPCTMVLTHGHGKAQLQRWAFNVKTRTCVAFIYTGLGGNENNFLTEPDCVGTCQAQLAPTNPCGSGRPAMAPSGLDYIHCSTSNFHTCPQRYYCHVGGRPATTLCCPLTTGSSTPCQLPLNTGTGDTALSRWHFDISSHTCRPFIYTGMGGNENNYLTVTDCRLACPEFDNPCPAGSPRINSVTGQVDYCSVLNPTCPPGLWCHVGANRQTSVCCPFASDPCVMPLVQGTGMHQLQRFYFDHASNECKIFIYKGSNGNQNNFLSLAACETTCGGRYQGSFYGQYQ